MLGHCRAIILHDQRSYLVKEAERGEQTVLYCNKCVFSRQKKIVGALPSTALFYNYSGPLSNENS